MPVVISTSQRTSPYFLLREAFSLAVNLTFMASPGFGRGRLIEGLKTAGDAVDLAATRIAKFDHRHFEDFVLGSVKTGRLQIDNDAEFAVAAGRRCGRLLRDKAAQDLLVACRFERADKIFGAFVLIVHRIYFCVGATVVLLWFSCLDAGVKGRWCRIRPAAACWRQRWRVRHVQLRIVMNTGVLPHRRALGS